MTTANNRPEQPAWDDVPRRALFIGAPIFLLCAVSALLYDLGLFFRSYLVAYLFWLGVGLGCLPIVMLQHLTGGAWGILTRRLLEAGTRTLPLLTVLGLPLIFGLPDIYIWVTEYETLPWSKQIYFGPLFFWGRTAFYFATWLGLAYCLNKWSRDQDETGDPSLPRRFRLLSAPGLVLYGLTITFAAIDWAMSLEPHWYSTIYGALFGIGQVLSAFAFVIVMLVRLAPYPPLAEVLSREHFRDLGSLLLAFVMVWAYMAFSQYLLIWAANLPEEVPWYVRRIRGSGEGVGLALAVLHFALPFLLLLSTDIKRNARTLAVVAGLVFIMRFVDVSWLTVPAFEQVVAHGLTGSQEHGLPLWLHAVTATGLAVGLGGVWLATFLWQLKRMPLLPLREPQLAEVMGHA